MAQTPLEDKIELYNSWYRNWNNEPFKNVKNLFDGCVQWTFTDLDLFDINRQKLEGKTFGIIINHELIPQLMLIGVKAEQITFFSDCDWRTLLVENHYNGVNIIRLPTTNDKKETKKNVKRYIKEINSMMKFNYVLNNVPFGLLKEFKSLAETLAEEKALIISGSRDYHNNESAFKNVEVYKYLGKCFPTAKITASVVTINPKGATKFRVVDKDNKEHVVKRTKPVPPGFNANDYIWAMDILDKDLPGYDKFQVGELFRKDAIFDKNGIDVAFTMGKANAIFDKINYGDSYEEIQKQSTAWSKVDPSQKSLLGGYGVHAIGISYMANDNGHLGNVKYMPPSMGCGKKTYWYPVKDEDDAYEAIKYLNHPDVVRLVSVLKSSVSSNSKETFSLIPHHSQASKWIKNYGS